MTKLTLAFGLFACAACGPTGTTTSGDGEGTAGGEGHRQSARALIGINPPEKPWSEMTHDEREMDMVGRFLPIMSEFFREHDAQEYASFGCETCHGTDMREREFEMPSPHLPPVPVAGSAQYREMAEHER